jgi:hypothetical protein
VPLFVLAEAPGKLDSPSAACPSAKRYTIVHGEYSDLRQEVQIHTPSGLLLICASILAEADPLLGG